MLSITDIDLLNIHDMLNQTKLMFYHIDDSVCYIKKGILTHVTSSNNKFILFCIDDINELRGGFSVLKNYINESLISLKDNINGVADYRSIMTINKNIESPNEITDTLQNKILQLCDIKNALDRIDNSNLIITSGLEVIVESLSHSHDFLNDDPTKYNLGQVITMCTSLDYCIDVLMPRIKDEIMGLLSIFLIKKQSRIGYDVF